MTFRGALEQLLAGSPSLDSALRGARRAAATDAPILVLGEAGSGRSTLARALHAASRRQARALVEVDVAVGPTELFESELFGHLPGAFTGAVAERAGRVRTAEGGSLVLDHVEQMPLAAQAKLLRLIAEGSYAPLGGEEVQADIRFIAIAAADLAERVRRGLFREDLFYRLEVLTFTLPPLRDRRDDLPALAEALLADLAARFGRSGFELTPRARRWMARHSWPGNLRQLRNLLERAVVMSDSGALDPPPPPGERRPQSLAETERRQIERALAYTRGRQGRAAELLGISRKTLWQKRRLYGLP